MAGPPGSSFDAFYADLKETEKKDSVLTPRQQIDRLLRPGATYRNLNPFEVLMVEPDLPLDEVKRKYRRLSILVHPDKNQDDTERAMAAFDAVKKAYGMLEDENTRKQCMEVVEEARGRTKQNMEEKRKHLRKQGKDFRIEEDDPAKYRQAVHILTTKLFADLERKRQKQEQKISDDAAKKREAELAAEERRNMEKEFAKNWEESRQGRVNSWLDFKKGKTATAPPPPPPSAANPPAKAGGSAIAAAAAAAETGEPPAKKKKKKPFSPMGFRPPKHKPESR